METDENKPFQRSLEQMKESEQKFKERFNKPAPVSEEEKKYWDQVNKSAPVENANSLNDLLKNLGSIDYRAKKQRDQVTDFETAQKLFMMIANKITGKPFEVNEFNREVIQNCIKWIIADKSCEWPLDKGIGLIGYYGTGKSHLFRIIDYTSQAFRKESMKFTTHTCPAVLKIVSESPNDIKKYYSGVICFDDLGAEETVIKNYGNTVGVMSDIIFEREIRHEVSGQITHFTSNLIWEEIEQKYGTRIYDRIQKMTTLIKIKQKFSFRKTN